MPSRDRDHSPQSVASTEAPRRRAEVMEYFGRLAPVYGEGQYYRNRRAAVVAAITPELAQARTILDLGSGPGVYSADLRAIARDARIVAADLSCEMLAAARGRKIDDLRLVRCDASELPFLSRIWQMIFCSHVLPFVSDLDRCLTEIARTLASGGALIAAFGGSGVRDQLCERIPGEQWDQFASIVFGARPFRRSAASEQRYRQAFDRAGLVPQARNVSFAVSWTGIEEWIALRWLTMVDEAEHAEAERILKAVRPADYTSAMLTFHEPLLIGRKP